MDSTDLREWRITILSTLALLLYTGIHAYFIFLHTRTGVPGVQQHKGCRSVRAPLARSCHHESVRYFIFHDVAPRHVWQPRIALDLGLLPVRTQMGDGGVA